MATAREHFALDWIKADLLETLNDARVSLDEYAEQGNEETRMRACLTSLHQVHGTLVMLDLKGVTQLADHLERLAQAMLANQVSNEATAGQALMQGILELPGYLDELQRGAEDNISTSMSLVNEIRALLDLELLVDPAGVSLREGASDEVIARFHAIGGPEKVIRIRSAYQNVLLSILKGEDRAVAVTTLKKIAIGLGRVTEGAPLARQWQAFEEFVNALKQHSGVLESEAVKLLRRVDLEIKTLAKDGEVALRRPVNMELVQQLLDAAVARENTNETVTGLQEAVARDISNNTLAISGRQALGSAATALQEDLGLIKDKLDLLVRTDSVDLEELRQLGTPLKQIGSTLSLLGFESSREIIFDQVDAIENLILLGDGDPQGVLRIAGALVQIDENLSGVVLGSGQTEVEQITSEAELQVLREARKDLDYIKQCIVDFVTAHWSIAHLESVPSKLLEIRGALGIIPLRRAIEMLARVGTYTETRLMQGYRPQWQELDQFADVISAIDYYLERLADESGSGADDILVVAERTLAELESSQDAAEVELGQAEQSHETVVEFVDPVVELVEPESFAVDSVVEKEKGIDADAEFASEESYEGAALESEALEFISSEIATDVTGVIDTTDTTDTADQADESNLEIAEEPGLVLEQSSDFDLSSDVFANLAGAVEQPEAEAVAEAEQPPTVVADAEAMAVAPDVEPPDPEIVEIFVEEIDEVLENIAEYLPQWAADYTNIDALTEVRRSFHTLKGSGRIVQALAIGELAWGVENMLNRVMDATVQPNDQFVSTIESALALVPGLRDAFEQGAEGDLDAISRIVEQSDVLASGGEIDTAVPASQAAVEIPAVELEEPVAEALSVGDLAEIEQIQELLEEPTPITEDLSDETSLEESFTTEIDEQGLIESLSEQDQESLDPLLEEQETTLSLFLAEALEHLDILHAENAKQPWTLSDPIARAFHTLAGGAALAEQAEIQLIVSAAYQVVESFKSAPVTDELRDFFSAAETHLRECLAFLNDGVAWEEPLEFVATADDLLAAQGSAPRAVGLLLDAPSTAALFEAEDELLAYLTAADRGEPTSSTEPLQATLADLVVLAGDMRAQPLADLAKALQTSLIAAAPLVQLPSGCATVLRAAYNEVIDQLNDIAVGSELADQKEMISALAGMDMSSERTANDAALEVDEERLSDELAIETPPIHEVDVEENVLAAEPSDSVAESDAEAEIAELASIDADLVEVFFEEAEEISEELEASILSWSEAQDNRLYMETLLRGLHTLKGGARLCGLASLGDLAHDFESIVIEVQTNERPTDDAMFAELTRRYDEIVNRLSEITAGFSAAQRLPAAEATVADDPVNADNVVELLETDSGADAFAASDESRDEQTHELIDQPAYGQLRDANEIVEALVESGGELPASIVPETQVAKADSPLPVDRGNQEMVRVESALLEDLVNLAGESSILRARMEQGMSDFAVSLDEMETTIDRLREQLRRLEIETETQILHRHERNDGPKYENFDPLEMDRYNQFQQLSRSLSESASDMLDLKDTLLFKARESETLLLQQARINTELQEGLMRTRMVPFSRLLPRLRRIVRQVSGELDKEIDFHVQNAEGELDRNLLERMVPPLEHMLRNAVDHGIEETELRRNFGKAATGRIDLRLSREGGDVVIEISDDGAGIDVESVRAKAIERGLMAPDAALNDEQVLQFVLAAGFSTAKSVTQISGRGVGLDVVASEVKQLGGSINIVSRAGKGTRFVLRVPFTVSVNRALMVSVAEDLYAIPLNTIEGIVLLGQDQLQGLYSSDSKTFEYAGVPYRLRYLGQYLGREYHGPGAGQSSVPVVLVRSGDHAVAIHVDQVQGSREIVVKSLGPQFAGVGGISGATILGDGSVVVILDLLALIRAQQFENAQRGGANQGIRQGPRCVMVVDDSVTVRKVTSRLLERQGMEVLVAKDGVEAVALLQERRPDIILLDIEMPRMDGFEVARQVRHDDRLGELPIVMISSRTGDKHKEHANQLGVNKFLGKPFQESELLATIDELVTRN